MSKRHHSMHANQSHAVMRTIHDLSQDRIEDIYGIVFQAQGTIFDPLSNKEFKDLREWADWCVANDEYETEEIVNSNGFGALT